MEDDVPPTVPTSASPNKSPAPQKPAKDDDEEASQALEDPPVYVTCFACKGKVTDKACQDCSGYKCSRYYCLGCVAIVDPNALCCKGCECWFCPRCAVNQGEKGDTNKHRLCSTCQIKTPTKVAATFSPVAPGAPKKLLSSAKPHSTRIADGVRKRLFPPEPAELAETQAEPEDLTHLSTQELDQTARELDALAKEAKNEAAENDRKRIIHEDQIDRDSPPTQRFYSDPFHGPTRVSGPRRFQLEIQDETWRAEHGSSFERVYSKPSTMLAKKYKSSELIRLEVCYLCKSHSANTVIANCGHAIYCINCSANLCPLKCHICDTSISRIIPILNPSFYEK